MKEVGILVRRSMFGDIAVGFGIGFGEMLRSGLRKTGFADFGWEFFRLQSEFFLAEAEI